MTEGLNKRQAEAAEWVVRLRAPAAGEADWLAFEAWLTAAPANRDAFDAADALWAEVDARSDDIAAALEETPAPRQSSWRSGGWRTAAFGAVAAAAVLALVAPLTSNLFASRPIAYATAKGERRTLQLADGTRVDLNSGSQISVRMDRGRREVVMADAEAAFDVTHDAARPFLIRVGDQTVRVVGTQFDVSHRDGLISVTVRRGLVRVTPTSGDGWVSLTPGQQLRHRDGAEGSTIDAVSPDDAFAWREGRLICRDEPLSAVVADLNRYFPRPIRLQGAQVAALRFSGVLTIDDESTTLQRLSDLLPLSATPSEGVIVLKSRDRSR